MKVELIEKYYRKIGCHDLFIMVDSSVAKRYNQMIQAVLRTYTRIYDSTIPPANECFYILPENHEFVFPLGQTYTICENDDNWLFGLINDLDVFYEEKLECTAIHGACICINGNNILIIGKRWSGKTTLAHYLLKISNGKYMSDDCVYLQNNCFFGFCMPLPVRNYKNNIADRADDVLTTIDDSDGVRRTLVVPSRIIKSMDKIDCVIFPQYKPDCIGEIMPIKSVDLFDKLICNVRSYKNMPELLDVITNLTKETTAYSLTYPSSDIASELLKTYSIF